MTDSQVTWQPATTDGVLRIGAASLRTLAFADDVVVLQLTGEVDLANGVDLVEALQCVRPPVQHVELDVRNLKFCDVKGLRAILTAQHDLWMQKVCLHLTGIEPNLRLVMSLTGLNQQQFPGCRHGRGAVSPDRAIHTSLGSNGHSP